MAPSADALPSLAEDEPSSRHLDDVGPLSVLSAMIEQRRASRPAIPIEEAQEDEDAVPETLREGETRSLTARATAADRAQTGARARRDSAGFLKAR